LGFDDPNFGIRFDETMSSFEKAASARYNPYIIESSLGNLRADRLKRLRDTHCLAVAPGIESWNQYANKAGTGQAVNNDKLEQVVTQFQLLHEYVPYLQANFIFGLDSDSGDLPFELTREFMRRLPFVWTYMNIPYAFGGTPLYAEFLREGRILNAMPFTFYIIPYLTVILKNYDPITYFQKMVELYALATSGQLLNTRLRNSSHGFAAYTHRIRTFLTKPMLAAFRQVLARLQSDPEYLAFHRGETDVLPAVYVKEYKRQLGKYAELMPLAESRPALSAETIVAANVGTPIMAPAVERSSQRISASGR
jgi:hypothetical protein